MCGAVLYAEGMKFEGEVIDLYAKGQIDGMMVENNMAEPKKYQVVWKEWSYQDNCEYTRKYQYDNHDDALKVQDFIVKVLKHFAIVQTAVPLEV